MQINSRLNRIEKALPRQEFEAPRLFIHHEADGTFQDFTTREIVSRDVIEQRQEGLLANIILVIE